MSKHLVPVLSLIAAIILLVMLNFTTPTGVGPLGVLVFFTTFYVLMFGVALGLVKFLGRVMGKKLGKKAPLYGAVVAFGPILLMLAQALGEVSLLTFALVVVFLLLGCLLVGKRVQV